MEAVYRRSMAGKRRARRTTASEDKGQKRRMVQLIASLVLFLLVFIGRGAFPAQAFAWSELLAADTDFKAIFQRFEQDLASDESIVYAFERLFLSAFGSEREILPEPDAIEQLQKPDEVIFLGQTELHGLTYLRTNGLRDMTTQAKLEPEPEPKPVESDPPQPEIVTAVAQTYGPNGEVLPSNVSYEYYELGLEQTVCPVNGTVSSGFEYRISPITGQREFHLALDIAAAEGTEIGAFADGVVRYIGESDEFGLYLMIDHANNVSTFYAHCSKLLVHKGDTVTCGQTVALVGHTGNATGSHLHLTILKDNIRLDPAYYVDPS